MELIGRTQSLNPLVAALLIALAACGGGKSLTLPDEMRRQPPAPSPARGEVVQTAAGARPAEATRAVVRMAEHGRTWEVELPDGAGPYELRIPLSGQPAAEAPTLADQQLGDKPAPKRSYLAAVAKIRELFAARRHELALIELGNAEADFPDDARLWAMKGTLYLQMGKRKLARTAWQKALALGPDDGVAQALRELGSEGE